VGEEKTPNGLCEFQHCEGFRHTVFHLLKFPLCLFCLLPSDRQLAPMFDWIAAHEVLLGWLFGLSIAMFVGSLLAVPWLVVRISADYFVRPRGHAGGDPTRHPAARIAVVVAKNLCGIGLLLAGMAMLVLPGQGILTILVGLVLIDFPGKFELERGLVGRPAVFRAINWMRAKAHRPPLQLPKRQRTNRNAQRRH
jgi:hypothetical protein